jgi:hypothetical protein
METYIPDDFLAGDEPLKTGRAFVKLGESFTRLTPLMKDATDKTLLVKWDGGAGTAVAMACSTVAAPASNTVIPFYKSGCFRISSVVWPGGVTTDAQKRGAFIGTPISVDDE